MTHEPSSTPAPRGQWSHTGRWTLTAMTYNPDTDITHVHFQKQPATPQTITVNMGAHRSGPVAPSER